MDKNSSKKIELTSKALAWDSGGASFWNYTANASDIEFKDLHKIDDIGNDGIADIVVGGYNTTSSDGLVMVLNGSNGKLIWINNYSNQILNVGTINDITGDGIQEVITSDFSDHNVYCLNGENGSQEWVSNFPSKTIRDISTIEDVNNDNFQDVIVSTQGSPNELYCINGTDGIQIWSKKFVNYVMKGKAISDVTGDDIPDVICSYGAFSSQPFGLGLVSGNNGTSLWNVSTNKEVKDFIEIPDINSDNKADVIFLTSVIDHRIVCVSGFDKSIIWNVSENSQGNYLEYNVENTFFDCVGNLRNCSDGTIIQSIEMFVNKPPATSNKAGLICSGDYYGNVKAENIHNGTQLWSFDTNSSGNSNVMDIIANVDCDGDGTNDFVWCNEIGRVGCIIGGKIGPKLNEPADKEIQYNTYGNYLTWSVQTNLYSEHTITNNGSSFSPGTFTGTTVMVNIDGLDANSVNIFNLSITDLYNITNFDVVIVTVVESTTTTTPPIPGFEILILLISIVFLIGIVYRRKLGKNRVNSL